MGKLFGTAGVRDVYGVEIDEMLPLDFGRSVARVFSSADVVVSWDGRLSSPSLSSAVIAGVLAEGKNVRVLGLAPMPAACRASMKEGSPGVYVTASHNPPEYNGLKALMEDGSEATRGVEEKIEREITSLSRPKLPERPPAVLPSGYGVADYLRDLVSSSASVGDQKVVADPGNGCASDIAPRVLSEIGLSVISVNDWVDGRFPMRPSEPTPENLRGLSELILRTEADYGIAWDGDADRVALIDSRGRFVPQYAVSCLVALALRAKRAIISVDMGWGLRDLLEREGGDVIVWRLGDLHSEYKRRLEAGWSADLVTEPWKIMAPTWGPYFDGIKAAALVAQAVHEFGSLEEALEAVPKYYQERMSFKVSGDRSVIFNRVTEALEEELSSQVREVDRLDGVKFILEDGWVLIRVSGTEPKIRVYVEAKTDDRKRELASLAVKKLREAGVT
ncbi:MAG TPA: hypothetical protein ENG69_02895 [Candidatus Korarchaeota archaeon]|nr:hypothetical protein [Candidatus Korarchaeota archaeon]